MVLIRSTSLGRYEPGSWEGAVKGLGVSHSTDEFEVAAEMSHDGTLAPACARRIQEVLDSAGFVVIPGILSSSEADEALALVRAAIDDPARTSAGFASETDSLYRRRDFCPMASSPEVIELSATLCQRLQEVLKEYCGRSRSVLEISTLTSYLGSSHQYVHRDPYGALCMFVAVDEVTAEQGGTVFVPRTHMYGGAEMQFDGKGYLLMELFRRACNWKILRHNLAKLWRIRQTGQPKLSPGEFRDRVFSRKMDAHQPNLARFLLGKTYQFNILMLNPVALWQMFRYRRIIDESFSMVQTVPAKGTVILYRSDVLHAGPDNNSERPRYIFSMSIARDIMHPGQWEYGYAPHSTLRAHPLSLGDLLDMKPKARERSAREARVLERG